jgi:hypothetical protein
MRGERRGAGLRLPAVVHHVRWGNRSGRVLTPARRLTGTVVVPPLSARDGMLVSSRADLLRLGAWVRLAAVSPHSIVYIPCRSNRHSAACWHGAAEPVDLVIVRSDAGLRPSAWKAVRGQLGRGRPGLLRAPQPRQRTPYRHWEWTGPDQIRMTEHAATLIVASTARALLDLGDTVTDAGDLVATSRQIHRHGLAHLIGVSDARDADGMELEFDLVGHDPLFHRRANRGRLRSPAAVARSRTPEPTPRRRAAHHRAIMVRS